MDKTISEYIELITKWAKDRELDKYGTIEGQKLKTIEEVSELLLAICKDRKEDIKDAIGDVFVTVVIGAMLTYQKESTIDDIIMISINNNIDYVENFLRDKDDVIYSVIELSYSIGETFNTTYYMERIEHVIRILLYCARVYSFTLNECIEKAYNEIKNRKGKMIDGTFVKESDLNN